MTKLSSDFVQNFLLQAKHPLISSHFNRLNSVKKKKRTVLFAYLHLSLVRLELLGRLLLRRILPCTINPSPTKKCIRINWNKLDAIRTKIGQKKLQLSKKKMATLEVEFVLPLPPGQVVLLRHLLPKLRPRPRRHRLQNPNLRDQVCRQWALWKINGPSPLPWTIMGFAVIDLKGGVWAMVTNKTNLIE